MDNIIEIQYMESTFLYIIPYIKITILLTFASMIFGCLFGLLGAVFQLQNIPVLKQIFNAVILICRSMPSLILLYLIYYAVPVLLLIINQRFHIHIPLEALPAIYIAVIGLGLHVGAYLSEVFRAAVLSVPKGQMEAALTQGMSWYQGIWRIVIPQAAIFAMPSIANNFLDLLKSTSVVFVITVIEIFGAAKVFTSQNYRYFEAFLVVGLVYWGLSSIFAWIFSRCEVYLNHRYSR